MYKSHLMQGTGMQGWYGRASGRQRRLPAACRAAADCGERAAAASWRQPPAHQPPCLWQQSRLWRGQSAAWHSRLRQRVLAGGGRSGWSAVRSAPQRQVPRAEAGRTTHAPEPCPPAAARAAAARALAQLLAVQAAAPQKGQAWIRGQRGHVRAPAPGGGASGARSPQRALEAQVRRPPARERPSSPRNRGFLCALHVWGKKALRRACFRPPTRPACPSLRLKRRPRGELRLRYNDVM